MQLVRFSCIIFTLLIRQWRSHLCLRWLGAVKVSSEKSSQASTVDSGHHSAPRNRTWFKHRYAERDGKLVKTGWYNACCRKWRHACSLYMYSLHTDAKMAESTAARTLSEEICGMEEMKKKTPVTISVLATANTLRQCNEQWAAGMPADGTRLGKKYQLPKEKNCGNYFINFLWMMDTISAKHSTNLLTSMPMKVFGNCSDSPPAVISSLRPPPLEPSSSSAKAPTPREQLSNVEENAIRYAAGYIT